MFGRFRTLSTETTMDVFEYYEEAERRDGVRLHWQDGGTAEATVDGVLFAGGENPTVHLVSTRGTRYALRSGDRVERISRGRGGFL
jgi:hypothetical protein